MVAKMNHGAVALTALTLAAAGCSSDRFKQPVHSFAETTVTAMALVNLSDRQLAQDRVDNDVGTVLAKNVRLKFDPVSCQTLQTLEACSVTAPSDPQLTFIGEVPDVPLKMALALKRYGEALQGVVDADVSGELDEKAKGLSDSAQALAELLKISGTAPVVDAAQFVVSGVVGAYLERRRLNVLQRNVPMADPLVRQMTDKLEELLSSRRQAAIVNESQMMAPDVFLVNDLPHSTKPADEAVKLAAIERVARRSARLRVLSTSDDTVAVDQVKLAHAKLAEEIKNPNVDIEDLAKELKRYADAGKSAYDAAHEEK